MTRFHITLEESVEFVLKFAELVSYEIFVPKIPSSGVDLASAVKSTNKLKFIEADQVKIREEMITTSDSKSVVELKDSYILCPPGENKIANYYLKN